MATDVDDVNSVDMRHIKCDMAPPEENISYNYSSLTGEAWESKAKAYTVEET